MKHVLARRSPLVVRRWLEAINRRPFGRLEAAFYEAVAAPAVRSIVGSVLRAELDRGSRPLAVLDVGCGSGDLTADLGDGGRFVVGADPSIAQARRLSGLKEIGVAWRRLFP